MLFFLFVLLLGRERSIFHLYSSVDIDKEEYVCLVCTGCQLLNSGQGGWLILQTNDYCAVPSFLKEKVSARYPGGRRALLKSGGDFPFLSRADEVNLHAQVSSFPHK
jgi:hypothetical protein